MALQGIHCFELVGEHFYGTEALAGVVEVLDVIGDGGAGFLDRGLDLGVGQCGLHPSSDYGVPMILDRFSLDERGAYGPK